VRVNVRQGAMFGDPLQTDSLREVQVKYGEDFQWTDHLVFNYGAEAGRVGTVSGTSYLRPRFGISWVPERRTTIMVSASSQAPSIADDPVRGKEYYDRTISFRPDLSVIPTPKLESPIFSVMVLKSRQRLSVIGRRRKRCLSARRKAGTAFCFWIRATCRRKVSG